VQAYLELVVCGAGATCSLQVGQRYTLPPGESVLLGRTPECDIFIRSDVQGGRKNCLIEPAGNGHVLRHAGHGLPLKLNDRAILQGDHRLTDGDLISPGNNLVLRYGVTGQRFPVVLEEFGPFLLFSRRPGPPPSWRAIRRSDPSAPPIRAVIAPIGIVIAVDDPAVPQMIESVDIDGKRALLFEDTSGVTYGEIVAATRAQGALLDADVACALLLPIARVLESAHTLVARVGPMRAALLGFDGSVRFLGFEEALVPRDATLMEPLGIDPVREIAAVLIEAMTEPQTTDLSGTPDERRLRMIQELGRRALSIPHVGPFLAEVVGGVPIRRAVDVRRALDDWGKHLGALPTQRDLAGLARNLFPERAREEDDLREQLSILDEEALKDLL
jgi:hypothetical protein